AASVAGREGEQRALLVARAAPELGRLLDDALGVPLAQRPVDVARLAEAAALHAAAHHLDARAVVNDTQVRDDRLLRWREAIEVDEDPLAHRRLRGLDRLDRRERPVRVGPGLEKGRHV